MYKLLVTLLRGRANEAVERVAAEHGLTILDQQMRDAGCAIGIAKRALALVMAEDRREEGRLEALVQRVAGLEERARAALAGGREDLAQAAAEAIAELEIDQANAGACRKVTVAEVARLRVLVRDGERRFVELDRGRRLARLGEGVRRGQGFGGGLGVADAEATLAGLRERQILEAGADAALEELSLPPGAIEIRLGDAGFGAGRPTALSVMARLRAEVA